MAVVWSTLGSSDAGCSSNAVDRSLSVAALESFQLALLCSVQFRCIIIKVCDQTSIVITNLISTPLRCCDVQGLEIKLWRPHCLNLNISYVKIAWRLIKKLNEPYL